MNMARVSTALLEGEPIPVHPLWNALQTVYWQRAVDSTEYTSCLL
jgi:hypothetical protein